ncbi:MAG: FecR domain-containing protein [Prolixibacteraceae bacterium]|jgi:ferric-dicitrate binding protein FerR (iron transport regulator)|nr:FecR domain-containing protein [Prolixibacteraceae bacterium]
MEKKIQQYMEGKLPNEGQRELLHWLRKEGNQKIFASAKNDWQANNTGHRRLHDAGQARLGSRIQEKQQSAKYFKLMQLYKYAAVAILVIALGGALAIFTLSVSKTELKYTEVYTDYGQVSGMTLPDGSQVWINAGTRLVYNNRFGIGNRDIKVEGEAFFSVSKDKKIPFVVDMGLLKVEVTGTRFGVSNYSDAGTMDVVLEEGSVNIVSEHNRLLAQLAPEEMARFNKNAMTIEKLQVNPVHYTSWRNGTMHIFELPLEQLISKLEKRFNQKFEAVPQVKDIPFTFSIEGESLPEILHLMEKIAPVKIVQEGETIKFKYHQKKE